jgi:hypothetical protein
MHKYVHTVIHRHCYTHVCMYVCMSVYVTLYKCICTYLAIYVHGRILCRYWQSAITIPHHGPDLCCVYSSLTQNSAGACTSSRSRISWNTCRGIVRCHVTVGRDNAIAFYQPYGAAAAANLQLSLCTGLSPFQDGISGSVQGKTYLEYVAKLRFVDGSVKS